MGPAGIPDTVDWSHANNLLYDSEDDSIVVSFLDRQSKEIAWIFGEPSWWGELSEKVLKAEGDLQWPYYQHSPQPTPNGTLVIFDNGNFQARPFRKPSTVTDTYTRAVECGMDGETMKARQLWQSDGMGPERVKSIAMGEVDWLPETENVLVAYGALLHPDSLARGKVVANLIRAVTTKGCPSIRSELAADPYKRGEALRRREIDQLCIGRASFHGEISSRRQSRQCRTASRARRTDRAARHLLRYATGSVACLSWAAAASGALAGSTSPDSAPV